MSRAAALCLALAACAPQAGGGTGGIVSVNPCADAMLVQLVPPERIAAISRYSQDPGATSIPLAVARRFRATAGTAEEVIALRPALVLASTFTPPATRDAYAQAGLRTVYLDSPTTVAASVAQVRQVAAAVGERAAGERMVGGILAALAPPRGPSIGAVAEGKLPFAEDRVTGLRPTPGWSRAGDPPALLYLSGDLADGSGNLLDELLHRAGFRNAAADYGLTYTGRVPLELLAAHPPGVVIAPDAHGRTEPLRRSLMPDVPQATFPRDLINCGGPSIPPALARLRAIRASLR